jgi:hypothetical protein
MNSADGMLASVVVGLIVTIPVIIVTALYVRWLFRINDIICRLAAIQAAQERQAVATEALLKAVAPTASQPDEVAAQQRQAAARTTTRFPGAEPTVLPGGPTEQWSRTPVIVACVLLVIIVLGVIVTLSRS